jgi:hypothetical protein
VLDLQGQGRAATDRDIENRERTPVNCAVPIVCSFLAEYGCYSPLATIINPIDNCKDGMRNAGPRGHQLEYVDFGAQPNFHS